VVVDAVPERASPLGAAAPELAEGDVELAGQSGGVVQQLRTS
jgi:hypothetical protein